MDQVALVINWRFHKKNKWVSAFSHYFVEAFVAEFNPIIISNQLKYNYYKKRVTHLVSMEPGWAAPRLRYDTKIDTLKFVMYSDPHNDTQNRLDYFHKNDFNYVLSFYDTPFFKHFKTFPREKFIHFPWAVADQFLTHNPILSNNNQVAIFGGKLSDAYDVRNWCREQDGVTNLENSGVENKIFTDEEYFRWIREFDAIIAAGSSNPKYELVTPKYFEIASSGALLFGQYCSDLEALGFNKENCVIFEKDNFSEQLSSYKSNPQRFLKLRENGRELINNKHLISHRIAKLKKLLT
jgi:hypothetical protein